MSFKKDMQREIRNIKRDVANQVDKTWTLDYQGHSIEVSNALMEERLLIDGVEVDANKRKSLFSHIFPFSKLSGTLTMADGSKKAVKVKLGGFVRFTCTIKVGSTTLLQETISMDFKPWDHKDKIESFIAAQVGVHGKVTSDELPDDALLFDENHPRTAAGFSDLLIHENVTPNYVKNLMKLFEAQVQNPTEKTRKATYEKILDEHVVIYAGELAERLLEAQLDEKLLQQEALWLLEHAAHREVVKFALILLGCTNGEPYKERIYQLGLHEEFTPYTIFALKQGTMYANDAIWRYAQLLNGWGKLAAIDELDAHTTEQKNWLLTARWEDHVMFNYAAVMCATKGELDIALYEASISKEMYIGAGNIIATLLNDDETSSIDTYEYAPAVLTRFVYHAKTHCETLADFYPVMKIAAFVQQEDTRWAERIEQRTWTQQELHTLQEHVRPFMDNPKWQQLAHEALEEEDMSRPLEILRYYEVDVSDWLFNKLQQQPQNALFYTVIMQTKNKQAIVRLSEFAEQQLRFSAPNEDELACMLAILQRLYSYDGVAIPLVIAALKSHEKPLQYHALSVLTEWSPRTIAQSDLQPILEYLASTSKDKELRHIAKSILELEE